MADAEVGGGQTPATNTPLMKNPVFLTAVFGAIIAAFANAYVAFINNNTLVDLETNKEAEEQYIEAKKAEFTRLLEISKLDVEPAKAKIKSFCDMYLITDSNICRASVLNQKANPPSQTPTSPKEIGNPTNVTWDSPWVGGGHNQQEMCNIGIATLNSNQYKGKFISLIAASEDSRKDLFGHVKYRYHCTYQITN